MFNFQRKGDTYKTMVGGIMSIVIKFALFYYMIICVKRMILMERDNVVAASNTNDLEELGNLDV